MPKPPAPRKPRTPAQRAADYRKTLPRKINDRRIELIIKKFDGFDAAKHRDPSGGQGWTPAERATCYEAALTPAEHAELAECTRIMNEWQEKSPWGIAQREAFARLRAEMEKIEASIAAADIASPSTAEHRDTQP